MMKKNIIIKESTDGGVVLIGKEEITGFIADGEDCNLCGGAVIYHDQYDAYFCPNNNQWLESNCGDLSCDYCKDRPIKPLKI